MREYRRRGAKKYWDMRVLDVRHNGCLVEMLNSGLIGFCYRFEEGFGQNRLKVGDEVKMECHGAPMPRLCTGEKATSHWPDMTWDLRIVEEAGKVMPIFSHRAYLSHVENLRKAKELKRGDVIEATVFRVVKGGILMCLEPDEEREEGNPGPLGIITSLDFSRQHVHYEYLEKMFPPGTRLKVWVICSQWTETNQARINLSTAIFEDDDHVGWMKNFPDRVMAKAEEGLAYNLWKRDMYIRNKGGFIDPVYPRDDGKGIGVSFPGLGAPATYQEPAVRPAMVRLLQE